MLIVLVRVPETVELEDWLRTLLSLESLKVVHTERPPNTALRLTTMLIEHLSPDGLIAESPIIREFQDGNIHYDWVLAARIEHILNTGESHILPAFIENAKKPLKDFELSQKEKKNSAVKSSKTLGNGQEKLKEGFKDIQHVSTFCNVVRRVLIDIGVQHPLTALNVRTHRWICEVLGDESSYCVEDGLPWRISLVPEYSKSTLLSYPFATKDQLLSYAFGSIFTAMAHAPDMRSQCLSLVAYQFLRQEAMACTHLYLSKNRDIDKKRGVTFWLLIFMSLKAISLPLIPQVLKWYVVIVLQFYIK